MSTERHKRLPRAKERGPNGRYLCRWCRTEVTLPKRTWCSQACVDDYRIKHDWNYARALVYERDKGICQECHQNTCGSWNCDHVVEVVNGGGQCGLENLQVLCIPCHKKKTKRLMQELALKRRLLKESSIS